MHIKFKKAFSLTEVLIIAAIISIMTAITFASLQGGKTKREVEVAAREVSAAIRNVQNDALSGKGAGVGGCNKYVFNYGGSEASNPASYNTTAADGTGCNPQSNKALLSGVIFLDSGTFSYTSPHGKISIIGAAKKIRVRKNSAYFMVCVYQSGDVKELESNAGDTIACP